MPGVYTSERDLSYVINPNLFHTPRQTIEQSITSEPTFPITTSNLLLYLDAGNVNSYPGTGTIWNNLIANSSYSASLVNGAMYSSTGSGAIVLDGSNDYIQTNFSENISSAFTVECGYYFSGSVSPLPARILASMHISGDDNTVFRLEQGDSQLDFGHAPVGDSGISSYEIRSTLFNQNNWHVGSFVWDGTTKSMYRNGAFVTSANSSATPIANYTGATLRIGARWDASLLPLRGYISFINVYNRALSASEILSNFDAVRSRFGL